MKYSIMFVVLLLVFSPVYAEEEEIDAGITPDSGLYFLDTFMDNMRLAFAAKGESKIKMQLDIAEERLAEVNAMALKGDINAMMKAEKNHERIFLKLQNEVRVEEGVEVGEEVRNRFEHHNTEVKKIQGDLSVMVKTKGDLTSEQEAEIEILIASFEGKFGKIKIDIDNDTGKARIKTKTSTQSRENGDCQNLDEEDCLNEDDCRAIYGPGYCGGDGNMVGCTDDEFFKSCIAESDYDGELYVQPDLEEDVCEGLSEEDCIADDTCGTIYRPGNCNGNSTAATCEAEDIYKGCASLAV